MKLKKGEWYIVMFNAIYILAFTIYYMSIKNFEFLGYISVLVFFAVLILLTLRKTNFDYFILWGLSIWGLLHLCGGGLIINGATLYKLQLWYLFPVGDTYILKFDQFVHAFGFGIVAIIAYKLLKPQLNNKYNRKLIYALSVLIAMGAGALNEMVEFIAAATVASGVGGYYNNGLDLFFNALGAIIGMFIVHYKYNK